MIHLFRSEVEIDLWCRQEREAPGATVPTSRFWEVAKVWYEDRFDPNWTPRAPDKAQAILAGAGLSGSFWALPGA